jgi:hypothetical protein
MASKRSAVAKNVDPHDVNRALAKAVYNGDIVSFRQLFSPASPARIASAERFDNPRYAYLLPDADEQAQPRFKEALAAVEQNSVQQHILKELTAERPPQLPSELVLKLADNAVRTHKFTSAAQAYELLRMRDRMQDLFYAHADEALDAGEVDEAVRGYLLATSLAYDYAAFPEPMPRVPNFPMRALMLHGEYPRRVEECVGMHETEDLMKTALSYLLLDAEAAARLDDQPLDVRLEFLAALNARRDTEWQAFAARFKEAFALAREVNTRLQALAQERATSGADLAREVAQQECDDLWRIPALLLGRRIPDGAWWQYLKELAYRHPAAVLFVARRLVGETEILVPMFREDSPVAHALGISGADPAGTPTTE